MPVLTQIKMITWTICVYKTNIPGLYSSAQSTKSNNITQQNNKRVNSIQWLCVLMALSCVGRTSRCKSVAKLKLIKRMDACNLSQYRVNKSGLWQVYWTYSFRETNPLLLCTQIRDDCRGVQPNPEMQIQNEWHSKLTQMMWSNGVKGKKIYKISVWICI